MEKKMKKELALGVFGLFMLGSVPQASASFEIGNMILSIYDTTKSVEYGFDLGNYAGNAQNVNLGTINLGNQLTSDAYFGIFSNESVGSNYIALFGLTNSDIKTIGATVRHSNGSLGYWNNVANEYNYTNNSATKVEISTNNPNSYFSILESNSIGGSTYAGLVTGSPVEGSLNGVIDGSVINMYLYQHQKLGTTSTSYGLTNEGFIQLTFHKDVNNILTADLMLNPTSTNEVPVPGALWLLGSGLAGLIGIRRRKNS
jgi:hypothetical protein